MKRSVRVIGAVAAAAACMCSGLALVACTGSASGLDIGVRYIVKSSISKDADKQTYYLFNSDGTGEYRYYSSATNEFTVRFDYTFIDKDKSTVFCTYRGQNGAGTADSNWTSLVMVSKPMVMHSTSGTVYMSEAYLKDHPEFGK